VLLTRPPLDPQPSPRRDLEVSRARLACIRHAASVRPEPGSNSQKVVVKLPFVHLKKCFGRLRPSIVRLIPSVKLKVITLTGALVFV
jgi:hypothetical protein